MKKYEYLKREYPEYISLNQFYQICKIAKSSARYLVNNGIVPCVQNSDNETWRYKIKIDDVITYLRRREQVGNMIPRGAVTNPNQNKYRKVKRHNYRFEYNKKEAVIYFNNIIKNYSDSLTTNDVSKITGLCKKTIREYISVEKIKAFKYYNIYYIAKNDLIDFLASKNYLNNSSPNDILGKYINDLKC